MNALLLGIVDQWRVGEVGVTLDLVDGGHDAGGLDDGLELVTVVSIAQATGSDLGVRFTYVFFSEVGHANGANFLLGKLDHG